MARPHDVPSERRNAGATRERILTALKLHGEQTTAMLGKALGVTGEAARQHLSKLAEEGLVEGRSDARGVGRPCQNWSLTAKGQARFPDAHAEVTVQLIDAVRQELGEPALEKLVAARARKARDLYLQEFAGASSLAQRVTRLRDIRTREGYMAETAEDGGALHLIENHCPIRAAASACHGFCNAELALFQELVGPGARVERVSHIMAGARCCAYRITPEDGAEHGSAPL